MSSFEENRNSTTSGDIDTDTADMEYSVNVTDVSHGENSPVVVGRRTNRKHLSQTLDANLFDDSTEENESSDEDLPTFL